MNPGISGSTVAILVSDHFEQAELLMPRRALEDAGAITRIVGERPGVVHGMQGEGEGDTFPVDLAFGEMDPNEFDALLIPGGAGNIQRLNGDGNAKAIVTSFYSEGKPLAALSEAVGLLVATSVVAGKSITGPEDLESEARAAGANWVDDDIVVDGTWVTARPGANLDAVSERIVDVFSRQMNWDPAREGSLRRQHPAGDI